MNPSPLIRRFARNPLGRDLAVGDIHGYFSQLEQALDQAGFDPVRDRLFSVGDLTDRGPDCPQALEWLARPWFHPVCGTCLRQSRRLRLPLRELRSGELDPERRRLVSAADSR